MNALDGADTQENAGHNPAADLVRTKLSTLYAEEPSAADEEKEIRATGTHSKHQKFMAQLMTSGKSLADIQLEWHAYYEKLPDAEKHQVWQEFYEQHSRAKDKAKKQRIEAITLSDTPAPTPSKEDTAKTMADLHKKVLNTVNAGGKLKAKHHIKAVFFSLAMASFVTGVLFFVTNNEKFIAPFIKPSSKVAAAPFITDGTAVGPETKVIIPKLNLETPIIEDTFDPSDEKATFAALEKGVVLYPDTGYPGEKDRNPVFFGHSSGNLFNPGVAKFIFVRLHELQVGDTYAVNYKGKQYVYKIFNRFIVDKTAVEYLYKTPAEYGKVAISTLLTCDPPGTDYKRLILQGEQISPDPSANVAPVAIQPPSAKPTEVPSNSQSLLKRLFGW